MSLYPVNKYHLDEKAETPLPCHKTAFDPAKHIGPFEQPNGKPFVYLENGETFEALRCVACGNTVARPALIRSLSRS